MNGNTGSMAEAISQICDVHGRFGDKVYRKKRNGEPWVYKYVFIPKYAPTVLSRRVNCIAKAAAALSNPREKGYSSIIKKIYYYTPYFVYAGNYDFTCNTFFKLRSKGNYKISFDGMSMSRYLSPRTKLNFWFEEEREYSLKLFQDGQLYSERHIIVIDTESDLEDTYRNWFFENLAEILALPEPDFRSLKIYRRGIVPNMLMQYIVGKTDQGVLYRSCFRERFMYVRSAYEHHHTASGDHFYVSQRNITDCWNAASEGFKAVWEKYHIRWFDANYHKNWKLVRQHNFWSRLLFRACGDMCFDPEELSPDNWLPGVETIGDLIAVAGMGNYGLSEEELNTNIF